MFYERGPAVQGARRRRRLLQWIINVLTARANVDAQPACECAPASVSAGLCVCACVCRQFLYHMTYPLSIIACWLIDGPVYLHNHRFFTIGGFMVQTWGPAAVIMYLANKPPNLPGYVGSLSGCGTDVGSAEWRVL